MTTVWIAEKPSAAKTIADSLARTGGGSVRRDNGYFKVGDHAVTFARGHATISELVRGVPKLTGVGPITDCPLSSKQSSKQTFTHNEFVVGFGPQRSFVQASSNGKWPE